MKKKLTLKGYHFSPNHLPTSDDYIFIIINRAGNMSIRINLSESLKPQKVGYKHFSGRSTIINTRVSEKLGT